MSYRRVKYRRTLSRKNIQERSPVCHTGMKSYPRMILWFQDPFTLLNFSVISVNPKELLFVWVKYVDRKPKVSQIIISPAKMCLFGNNKELQFGTCKPRASLLKQREGIFFIYRGEEEVGRAKIKSSPFCVLR